MLKPVDLSGGKSVLRSVLNIFVSQSTEKSTQLGYLFKFYFEGSTQQTQNICAMSTKYLTQYL